MNTAIIILAAGASSRMGEPKQLVKVGGQGLLERALATSAASGLSPIIVVLGANADRIQRECNLGDAIVIVNERWQQGMSTSLQSGISTATALGAEAAVVMSSDMPFVDGEHIRALVSKAAGFNMNVASSYQGSRGIPACFLAQSFAAIAQLSGDVGGRVLLRYAPVVELLNGMDVDTPEELRQANALSLELEG